MSGGNLEWKFDKIKDSYKCYIFINSKLLAEAYSSNQKVSEERSIHFLDYMNYRSIIIRLRLNTI